MGFKKGLISVLVDIFGIYGACLIAWLFQDSIYFYFQTLTNLSWNIHGSVFFLAIWLISYFIIYIFGQFVTSLFKITGLHFLMRLTGASLNITKGIVILVVILTVIDPVSSRLYARTSSSQFFVSIGSMVINRYNSQIDERAIVPIQSELNSESLNVIDDFQKSILEQ